jgi:hypothetical protein
VKTKAVRLLLSLAAVAAACAAGCKPAPKPMKFNRLMVEANDKLANSAKSFRKTVEPLSEGKAVKAGDVDSAYRNMASTLASVKSDWEDMKAPMNSNSGETMLEKYQSFLEAQDKVLARYQGIVSVVKDGQLAPAAKWAKINAAFRAAESEESKAMGPLRSAQTAYAKEHNFQLDGVSFSMPSMGGSGGAPAGPPAGMAPPGMAGPGGGRGGAP